MARARARGGGGGEGGGVLLLSCMPGLTGLTYRCRWDLCSIKWLHMQHYIHLSDNSCMAFASAKALCICCRVHMQRRC